MTNNKRRTMVAAGLGSALALTAIGGAGSVLANSSDLAGGLGTGSPDGYVLEMDDAGQTWLLDGDGLPVLSSDDGDHEDDGDEFDGHDEDHDDDYDDDDYDDEDDHDSDEDEYEDGDDEGMATAVTDADRQYAPDEVVDLTSAGARLVLAYDAANSAFSGIVENTTDTAIDGVRIRVDLSDGSTLGPTEPIDLAAGESAEVSLSAEGAMFESFSASAV